MKEFNFDKSNMPPVAKGIRLHSFDAKTTDGKPVKTFLFRSFSAPQDNDLYLISQFFLSERSMKNLKKVLQEIEKEHPEIFQDGDIKLI